MWPLGPDGRTPHPVTRVPRRAVCVHSDPTQPPLAVRVGGYGTSVPVDVLSLVVELVGGLVLERSAGTKLAERNEERKELRKLATELSVPVAIAAAVNDWLAIPEVRRLIAVTPSQNVADLVYATVEPLKWHLRVAGVDVPVGFADDLVKIVHGSAAERAPAPLVMQAVLDDLEELKLGQAVLYQAHLDSQCNDLEGARRQARKLFDESEYWESAKEWVRTADLARSLGSSSTEALALQAAGGAVTNCLFSGALLESRRTELVKLWSDATTRRAAIVGDLDTQQSLMHAVLAIAERREGDALDLLSEIRRSPEVTAPELAQVWGMQVSLIWATGDQVELQQLVESAPDTQTAMFSPELAMIIEVLRYRSLARVGLTTRADAEKVALLAVAAAHADPTVIGRAIVELIACISESPLLDAAELALHLQVLGEKAEDLGCLFFAQQVLADCAMESSPSRPDVALEHLAEAERLLATGVDGFDSLAPILLHIQRAQVLTRWAETADDGTVSDILNRASFELGQADSMANDVRRPIPTELAADIALLNGRCAAMAGALTKAREHFERCHRLSPKRLSGTALLAGARAALLEGDWETAAASARQAAALPGDAGLAATSLATHIETRIRPVIDWLDGPECTQTRLEAVETSPREWLTRSYAQLIELLQTVDWKEASFLYDYWHRGWFLHIATALSTDPLDVITIDASSVGDIASACRLLCPLFETVVIKWKGEMECGVAIGAVPDGFFLRGGHGFEILAGTTVRLGAEWTKVASASSTRLPPEVMGFLLTRALRLWATGRLVVVPAAVVGCNRSAVGWTDAVLSQRLLGGAVNATVGGPAWPERELDLGSVNIPFIEGVPLDRLGEVLDDIGDGIAKYRTRIMHLLDAGTLSRKNWAGQKQLREEIRAAFGGMEAEWKTLTSESTSTQEAEVLSLLSVVRRADRFDDSSSILAASAGMSAATWFPLWRLAAQGSLGWTVQNAAQNTAGQDAATAGATWLCPGTHGLGWRMIMSGSDALARRELGSLEWLAMLDLAIERERRPGD